MHLYLPNEQETSDENTHLCSVQRQLITYSLRINYMPRTVLATHGRRCGRCDKVISELYLRVIFVISFQNDVLCQKLGMKFNPNHQGYACTSQVLCGEILVFSWSWKKAECHLIETGTCFPFILAPDKVWHISFSQRNLEFSYALHWILGWIQHAQIHWDFPFFYIF